jgi:hypothetical protein
MFAAESIREFGERQRQSKNNRIGEQADPSTLPLACEFNEKPKHRTRQGQVARSQSERHDPENGLGSDRLRRRQHEPGQELKRQQKTKRNH